MERDESQRLGPPSRAAGWGLDDETAATPARRPAHQPADRSFCFTVDNADWLARDGVEVSLAAQLADGAGLPWWLLFDAEARTLSGQPPRDSADVLQVVIRAARAGGEVSSTGFTLEVFQGMGVTLSGPHAGS